MNQNNPQYGAQQPHDAHDMHNMHENTGSHRPQPRGYGYANREPDRAYNQRPESLGMDRYGNPQVGGYEQQSFSQPQPGQRNEQGQFSNRYQQQQNNAPQKIESWHNQSDAEYRRGYRFSDSDSPLSQPFAHSTGWEQQYKHGYGRQAPQGSNAYEPYQDSIRAGQHGNTQQTHHSMTRQNDRYPPVRPSTPQFGDGYSNQAVFSGGGVQSPPRPRSNGPKNYTRSDERIFEDVCERICENPQIDSSEVEIDVNDRRVTIKGTVTQRWMKHQIEDLADEIRGVTEVENKVKVQRSDTQSAADEDQGDAASSERAGSSQNNANKSGRKAAAGSSK